MVVERQKADGNGESAGRFHREVDANGRHQTGHQHDFEPWRDARDIVPRHDEVESLAKVVRQPSGYERYRASRSLVRTLPVVRGEPIGDLVQHDRQRASGTPSGYLRYQPDA
jgi:hypothetical protein